MLDETLPSGATEGEDVSGLLLTHLVSRADRNAAEAEAISLTYDAYIFNARRKKQGTKWLTDEFIRQVHTRMFGSIWEWAGQYRKVKLNIGVEPHLVQEQIKLLCDDFSVWDSTASNMPIIEVAAFLQNRLTRIHAFRNGNGRHARLITDIFFYSRSHPLPQWPQIHQMSQGNKIREKYIAAMRQADEGDYTGLVRFIKECLPNTQ